MSKTRGSIAAKCLAVGIGLTSACAPVAAAYHGLQDEEPVEQREAQPQASAIEEQTLDQQDAYLLESEGESTLVLTTSNAAVYFRGFYHPEDLDEARIERLGRSLLRADVVVLQPGTEQFEPIEILTWDVAGREGSVCLGLMQIVRGSNAVQSGPTIEEMKEELRSYLPPTPLTESCTEGDLPPMPAQFEERAEIEYYGPVLREPPRPCATFRRESHGAITFAPNMRIDFHSIVGSETMPRNSFDQMNRHIGGFIRTFASSLYRSGYGSPQIMKYGNYQPRPHDLVVEVRVVEDVAAGVICYVADVSQGEALERFVHIEQSNGKTLRWTSQPGREFVVDAEIREFGTRVAATLGATD
ncbi:hypothetical protein [Alteraurantiacibacter aquimixticola]|uniref:Uncharacterized protein n=1 Tax=Alteraurantiacibacter aquimixticola TaxID=2489173 RepID=A0A4T3F4Y9_9SPHN|nr:hypothetical protein [Alteraurantiacibacter aquimixticola]TIX51891.1 hypothetical protein E5222_05485 [Alteraurantiacibacter aquimixticola]